MGESAIHRAPVEATAGVAPALGIVGSLLLGPGCEKQVDTSVPALAAAVDGKLQEGACA